MQKSNAGDKTQDDKEVSGEIVAQIQVRNWDWGGKGQESATMAYFRGQMLSR